MRLKTHLNRRPWPPSGAVTVLGTVARRKGRALGPTGAWSGASRRQETLT